MASIDIDGRSYPVEAGDNLLKACLELGLDLPYFCWHPALGSVGACRQCAVIQYQNPEDQRGRLVMACMTPVADGMRVSLQAPQARDFRAGIIELLMTNHPHDCPVCEEGGECHLQDMTEMTGHTFRRCRGAKRTHRNQDLGPFINHEMNRCIACYRCVRYYQDYCGGHDLQVFAAHNHVYFGRHENGALENEFSGNLVEVCPTGVFTDKTFSKHYTRRWDLQSAPSVCPHCALGCNTSPGERYGTLRRIVNRYHGEINGYFLCDRGRFGYGFINGERRIRRSRIRNQPPLGSKGLANLFGSLLRNAKGVIGIGSPRASLEANFALRELVGAENFHLGVSDNGHAMLETLLTLLRQAPLRIATLREAAQADAVLVLGEDVSNTAPRLALALRQAVRNREFAAADGLNIPRWQDAAVRTVGQGQLSPLYIASFAPTRLDDVAAGVFRGGPDELADLGYEVADRLGANEGHRSREPLDVEGWNERERIPGDSDGRWNSFQSRQPMTVTDMAERAAAALVSAERPLIVCGTGGQSADLIAAAAQIATVLSAQRQDKPTTVHFAVPECNSLGLAMMGGGSLDEAFAAIEQARADTVVILENDLYRRAPKARVDAFLAKAGHVVVIDHLDHDTAARAELVLAAATYAESEGSWVSSEGRAQRHYAVFPPADGVRESWRWLAGACGKSWRGIDEVARACAEALPVFQGLTEAAPPADFRLAGRKIPRQPHRYSGRTVMLAQLSVHEPKQPVDAESPLAFSMEGATAGQPPALKPYAWAPGWNSAQAVNKFQDEIGGHLRGGDPGMRLIEPRVQQNPFPLGRSATKTTAIGERSEMILPPRFQFIPLHHIFGSEELSILAEAIAERAPNPYLALCPEDAAELGLEDSQEVNVTIACEVRRLPLRILPGLARGLAGIPANLPGLPWAEFEGLYWEYRP